MKNELLKALSQTNYKEIINDMHSYDLANAFLEIDNETRKAVIESLDVTNLAMLVSYLDLFEAIELLKQLEPGLAKEVLNELEPDDAADIILELEASDQEKVLSLLGEEEKELVESLLKYEETETGAYMTTSFVSVLIDDEIKVATKKLINEAPEVESIKTIFVTDEVNKYQGTISLKKLLSTKSPAYIKDIFEVTPTVNDKSDIESTVNSIKDYGIYEMPVISNEGILLGMITMDDALDIMHEEHIEDYEKLALLPDEEFDDKISKTAFKRLPWLAILLILTIPIALVTSGFEELLTHMVILMVFQPLILDSAGNVGTQTLAVLLNILNKDKAEIRKNTIRELISGFINGFLIGLIAGILAYIMAQFNTSLVDSSASALEMSLIIGVSLWIVVIIAPIVAIIIPLFLKLIKVDPAVASGPFITTIIDVLSLLIYFGAASLMLGGSF